MTNKPKMHPACGTGITLIPTRTDNDTCIEGNGRTHRCVSENSLRNELYEQIQRKALPQPTPQVQYLVFFPHNV
jgi:hypothetical protein